MPYRRLPNTDQARLRALKTALYRCESQAYGEEIVSSSTLFEARNVCTMFENNLMQYRTTYDNQTAAGRQYQTAVYNARMYVSHFIQVFNMAVVRGEIKAEHKRLYGLDPETHTVPDLSTDAALLLWGQRVIDGEMERTRHGGVQIYNPTISKVKVYYELFKECAATHKLHQDIAARNHDEVTALRGKCDELILSVWNQVEARFATLPPGERLARCREFGLIYYYRKGEERVSDN